MPLKREPWRISRANDYYSKDHFIQITNDRDCMNTGTLSPLYTIEGKWWWDVREALKAAFELRKLWKQCQYIQLDGPTVDDLSEHTVKDAELVAQAQLIYEVADKCDVCGELIEYTEYWLDESETRVCSDHCAAQY